MLKPFKIFSKIFKSSNQKQLDKLAVLVDKINNYEKEVSKLDDIEFPKKTLELKQRLAEGSKLNDLLPESFALIREASKRVNNERHLMFS
tara:strand:- start:551 stop:820 length:270 start_codon:yes stop_codon:yes gene_type:complete